MTFEDFARGHGLILNSAVTGKWVSVPTEDHPRKQNGRYKFLGDIGWVQNWATMPGPEMWRSSRPNPIIRTKIIQENNKAREMAAAAAAKKAAWIMHQTKMEHHPYLEKKGFPEDIAPVWAVDGKRILVIPMRIDGRLVGVQLINEEGEKKFLYGQVTKGASFTIDAKGVPIFVEGFATGLSVRAAMKAAKLRYTLHICFSAGNLEYVAGRHPRGFVVADNDPNGAGESCCSGKQNTHTGFPPHPGKTSTISGFAHGTFQASQSLKSALNNVLSSNAGTSPQSPGPSPD
jgi:putative DNA primase/helicase